MSSTGKTFLALQPHQYPERVINCKDFSLEEAKDFTKTKTENISGYLTMDPRTYDAPRQQYLLLDTPPLYLKNTQPLTDLYSPSNNVQTGFYPSYESINGGSIIYYNDFTTGLPFVKPVYQNQSLVRPSILQNPMGQTSTIYERIPIPSEKEKSSPYSFDRDQMEFREDLIALQSQKMYKNSYDSFQFYKSLS